MNDFLKWLDFSSIHYQPLMAWHVLVPKFRERKSPFGPVRVWDTESWVANTDELVTWDNSGGASDYDSLWYSKDGIAWTPIAEVISANQQADCYYKYAFQGPVDMAQDWGDFDQDTRTRLTGSRVDMLYLLP